MTTTNDAPAPATTAENSRYQQLVVIEDKYRRIFVHCRNPVPQAPDFIWLWGAVSIMRHRKAVTPSRWMYGTLSGGQPNHARKRFKQVLASQRLGEVRGRSVGEAGCA